jgi:hypothetical protein
MQFTPAAATSPCIAILFGTGFLPQRLPEQGRAVSIPAAVEAVNGLYLW